MGDGDWDALASDLVRQNYAFVATFSVIIWDCLITFRQEVKYVWHCSSRVTKYSFLFCRYWAVGYFIVCSIFGTQWTLRISTSSKDCTTWFFIHITAQSFLYLGSQLILIRKVYNLYGKSALLASGLFALHCSQVAGTLILSRRVADSLNFNQICNGRIVPNFVFSLLATATCIQCITWSLILRKVWKVQPRFFPRWRRYLRTSEAHTRMSWGLCLVAVLATTSHSFVIQRFAPVYIFILPTAMLSIGMCRYILRFEKDRAARSKLAEAIDADESRVKQSVVEQQPPFKGFDTLPMQNRHQHPYPPQPPAEMPSRLSGSEAPSIRTSGSQAGEHNLETQVKSNFPYMHGAQSYILKKSRRSMGTTITNHSPRSSSEHASRQTASVRTLRSRSSGFGSEPNPQYGSSIADSTDSEMREDSNGTHSASDSNIEIGSLQSSSSVDSEELRRFYNGVYNVGPFMAGGP